MSVLKEHPDLFTDKSKLSDIEEAEQALEVARKHMPEKFVWENNGSDSLMSWVLKAMIEFRND